MTGTIYKSDDGYRVFTITVRGETYGINVDYLPKDKEEWFIDILSRICTEIDKRSELIERKRLQKEFRNLLGIKKIRE